ncbi:MAG TPA: hypothetical protein VFI91_04210 [Longimicrobiaceae bacterium]|nr:hypothetical protein [Longimicrobiaceae bacterium]
MNLLLASVVLALIAAAWVLYPIFSRRVAVIGDAVSVRIFDLEARKRAALASLKEVEYDRIGGKLDEADYLTLRARLEAEALAAVEAADRIAPATDAVAKHSCGFTNPAESRFCSGCGALLA